MATPQELVEALDRLAKMVEAQNNQLEEHAKRSQAAKDAHARMQRHHKGGLMDRAKTAFDQFKQARGLFSQRRYIEGAKALGRGMKGMKQTGKLGGRATGMKGLGTAGKAAGVAGAVITIGLAAVETFKRFKHHVESTTEELVRAQKKLAENSPSMAGVMAKRDAQEAMRDRAKGEALASSAQALVDAEQRRKDRWANWDILITDLWNRAEAFLNGFLDRIGEEIGLPAKIPGQDDQVPLAKQMNDELLDRNNRAAQKRDQFNRDARDMFKDF